MSVQAIEAALVQRLVEKLKDTGLVVRVYTAGEYALLGEESQLHPAVAVIYNGYTPGDEVGQGVQQAVTLEFLVVAITRSAVDFNHGGGAAEDVSPIFDATVQAVIGWRPTLEGGTFPSTFKLAAAPGSAVSGSGFAYWPMAFTIRRTYRGTP